MLTSFIGGPRSALGSAVACGILLSVFEGVGVLISRVFNDSTRPQLPPCAPCSFCLVIAKLTAFRSTGKYSTTGTSCITYSDLFRILDVFFALHHGTLISTHSLYVLLYTLILCFIPCKSDCPVTECKVMFCPRTDIFHKLLNKPVMHVEKYDMQRYHCHSMLVLGKPCLQGCFCTDL